jgi:hypothetical protein
MWHQGARTALVLSCSILAACGAKTLDFTGPDGGGAGSGGAGGGAGNDGAPTGPYVTTVRDTKVAKIDLLFMIDNSSSMADKQVILGSAVSDLVDQLVAPRCIDPITGRTIGEAINGTCAVGQLAFPPVNDIHIGVISSSIGAHGASGVCDDASDFRAEPHNDDRAHLLTRGVAGTTVPTFDTRGFLNFNPALPGALGTGTAVALAFSDLVKGVGQHGCGYSAPLEAAYRFLIDPDPYDSIVIDTSIGGSGVAVLSGTDKTLLQQRAEFLRPDSLVSVVLVTDENDCSVADGGQGFYSLLPPVTGTDRSILRRGTSKCLENPNDRCCFNCGMQTPPDGCAPPGGDPECMKGLLTVDEDPTNLRCFHQKQRYGADFLYPVQRYIDGFSKLQVPNRQGQLVNNPLFFDPACTTGAGCAAPRDKSLVWLTGVVGVPWQDIAVDPLNLTAGFKTAKQLREGDVWANIVGDPQNETGPVPPRDLHMIESIQPRPGLAGPESAWNADPVHGHEWNPSKDPSQPNADLQYACTFPLSPLRVCTSELDCDCFGPNVADMMKPLCQSPQSGYGNTQSSGKAYPGTRILQVLQGLGDQAIVGSICPANVTDLHKDDFGYSPVVRAVINRLRQPLGDQCLPVALPVDTTSGQSPCAVIEVHNGPACNCDAEPGRRAAAEALLTEEIKALGTCRCEIKQFTGAALSSCRTLPNVPASNGDGWCYVDPAQQGDATCDAVSTCPMDQQRRLRFGSVNSEPRPGATAFLRCDVAPIAPLPPRCQ